MKAIVDGSHPPAPIQELIGFDLVEAEEGRTLFSSLPGLEHLNPIAAVHGGFAGLLLDSCMGAAVHRAMTPEGGEALAEGRVVHRGRRVATADGFVRRASDGKLFAHGTSTCMIL